MPREELDFLILQVVRGASPTRRRVGSCGWSSFQPGSRGAAVARAARLALTPARQPAGFLYRWVYPLLLTSLSDEGTLGILGTRGKVCVGEKGPPYFIVE